MQTGMREALQIECCLKQRTSLIWCLFMIFFFTLLKKQMNTITSTSKLKPRGQVLKRWSKLLTFTKFTNADSSGIVYCWARVKVSNSVFKCYPYYSYKSYEYIGIFFITSGFPFNVHIQYQLNFITTYVLRAIVYGWLGVTKWMN